MENLKVWWQANVSENSLTHVQHIVFQEACESGYESIVLYFWNSLPRVCKESLLEQNNFSSILKTACRSGNESLFHFWWEKGVGLESNHQLMIDCLHLAAEKGHLAVLNYLLVKAVKLKGIVYFIFSAKHVGVRQLTNISSDTSFRMPRSTSSPNFLLACSYIGPASYIAVY